MTDKLTVNRLSEGQMQKVRSYLVQMPNKFHEIHEGIYKGFYGNYISVTADVRGSVDESTAKTLGPWYENVAFEIKDVFVKDTASNKRYEERNEVAKGLASLVAEFLIDNINFSLSKNNFK